MKVARFGVVLQFEPSGAKVFAKASVLGGVFHSTQKLQKTSDREKNLLKSVLKAL